MPAECFDDGIVPDPPPPIRYETASEQPATPDTDADKPSICDTRIAAWAMPAECFDDGIVPDPPPPIRYETASEQPATPANSEQGTSFVEANNFAKVSSREQAEQACEDAYGILMKNGTCLVCADPFIFDPIMDENPFNHAPDNRAMECFEVFI